MERRKYPPNVDIPRTSRQGSYDDAERYHRLAVIVARRGGSADHFAEALGALGGILLTKGQDAESNGQIRNTPKLARSLTTYRERAGAWRPFSACENPVDVPRLWRRLAMGQTGGPTHWSHLVISVTGTSSRKTKRSPSGLTFFHRAGLFPSGTFKGPGSLKRSRGSPT